MTFSGITYKNICQKRFEGIFDKMKNKVDNSIYPKKKQTIRARGHPPPKRAPDRVI